MHGSSCILFESKMILNPKIDRSFISKSVIDHLSIKLVSISILDSFYGVGWFHKTRTFCNIQVLYIMMFFRQLAAGALGVVALTQSSPILRQSRGTSGDSGTSSGWLHGWVPCPTHYVRINTPCAEFTLTLTLNCCHVEFVYRKFKNIVAFPTISEGLLEASSWNPSLWKTRIHYYA